MKVELNKTDLNVPANVIYVSQYGSHLYGLNTETSDIDYRGVFVPYKEDVLLKKDVDEYNDTEITDSNTDVKLFSIYKFIKLCSKGDTNALDLLFSYPATHIEKYNGTYGNKSLMGFIYENRNKLINTNNMYAYTGYATTQARKYGTKGERYTVLQNLLTATQNLPQDKMVQDVIEFLKPLFHKQHLYIVTKDNHGTKENYLYVCGTEQQFNLQLNILTSRIQDMLDKYAKRTIASLDGNDWKALSHALRVLYQLEELFNTGNIVYPLRNKDFLMDIKLGKVSREIVDTEINRMLDLIQEMGDPLGWRYDEQFWNEYILRILR